MHNRIQLGLLGVYHPPTSSNVLLDSIFNLVILGDFNLHVNDPSNNDAIILLDAMSALGFKQMITKVTHNSGNTLDLVFVEDDPGIGKFIMETLTDDFLSDHH